MILVCFAIFGAHQASASVIPKPSNNLGLIGYWSMEEATSTKATDFSGSGNTGTLNNMEAADWITGKVGTALSFDGVDEYVDMGDVAAYDVGTGAYTVSFWFKSSGFGGAKTVLSKDDYDTGTSGFLAYTTSTNLIWYVAGAMDLGNVADGKWHHVVATRVSTGANQTFVYLDGVLSSTNTDARTLSNASSFKLADDSSGNSDANVSLDDVRVYNRSLSAAEALTLYTNSTRRTANKSLNRNGLIGHWSFEDATSTKATDFSGNRNTGTLTNFALSGSTSNWVAGKISRALNFDGSNDFAQITNSTGLQLGTGPMTCSAWVYPTGGTNYYYPIVAVADASTGFTCMIGHNTQPNAGNVPIALLYNGGSNIVKATTNLSLNNWHHIAVTVSAGGAINFYLNGVLDNSTTITWTGAYTGTSATLGSYYTGATYFFMGSLDDIRLYNRVLSATEIATLYNQTKITKINSSQNSNSRDGLVGMWSFNGADMTATKALDVSINDNHGTLTNGPTPAIGKIGQALKFDGVDDKIVMGASAGSNDDSTSHTYVAWVYPTTLSGAAFYYWVIDNGEVSAGTSMVINSNAGGKIAYFYAGGGSVVNGNTAMSINNWYHIATSYDASTNKVTFYLNGVADGTSASLGVWNSSTNATKIGTYSTGQYWFAGSIDDTRIYNRALSASEILNLYNQGK